jgi:hypothetical protein
MIYYLLFSFVCLFVFVFHNWYHGENLNFDNLFGMILGAFWPLINVFLLAYAFIELSLSFCSTNGVLLKGKKIT